MAYRSSSKGKERTLRGSDSPSDNDVSALTSMVVAALCYALNQEGLYHSIGKPSYSGGFYVTCYDGDDKVRTYFAAHDEPRPVAEELLDAVARASAIRAFESLLKRMGLSDEPRASETGKGVADVSPTHESTSEPRTTNLRGKRS